MDGSYRKLLAGVLSVVMVLTGATVLSSCTPEGGNNIPAAGEPLFSDDEVQALRSAKAVYDQAVATMTEEEARAVTVQELNNDFPGITTASLSEDGYSIFVEFANGTAGVVYTLDTDALSEGMDEWEFVPPDDLTAPATQRRRPAVGKPEAVGGSPTVVKGGAAAKVAGGCQTPNSKRVLLLGAAEFPSVTDPISHRCMEILTAAGWRQQDIDIKLRREDGDMAVTPEDVFSLGGYGVVVLIGHGGFLGTDVNPDRYFYFQCCDNADFSPVVGAQRWAQYQQWMQEHKLMLCVLDDPTDTGESEHLLVRSDLLEEQMDNLPGSYVHLVSCRSWAAKHAFESRGCGGFLGWTEGERWIHGCQAVTNMLWAMTQDPSSSDKQAREQLRRWGLGVSDYKGADSVLNLYTRDDTFYLPAWADAWVDWDLAPDGTDRILVELSYTDPALAGAGVTEELIGISVSFEDLLPLEAKFKLTAQDSSGVTLASGQETVQLHAGYNDVDLEFCTTRSFFSVEENALAARFTVEAEHLEPTVEWAESFELEDENDVEYFFDIPVGDISTVARALDADGTLLGISEQTFSLDCDDNSVEACMGWVTAFSWEVPPDTTKVTVETAFEDSELAVPDAVEYDPDSTAIILGFRLGSEVTFTATAENAVGQVQGTKTVVRTITCGENAVSIDFFDYGIILQASPSQVLADGTSTATVTATLKKLTEDDLLEPTGDPVAGKLVEFDTSLGTFTGANPVMTGADGTATIELFSAEEGLADLVAFVEEDLVESNEVSVRFGEQEIGVIVEASPATVRFEPSGEGRAEITATVRYWQDGDTDEPTGNPVAGRQVYFSTSLGALEGINNVPTNSAGTSSITLTCSNEGEATVTATVDGESGSDTVAFEEGDPNMYYGTLICEVERDYEAYGYSYKVYVEFDKLMTDPAPSQYNLEGYGFNDTLWYGTSHSDTGPPWDNHSSCQETESTFKVFLTGGCSSGNPDNNDKTDEEICAQPTSRFEGGIWEVTPVY